MIDALFAMGQLTLNKIHTAHTYKPCWDFEIRWPFCPSIRYCNASKMNHLRLAVIGSHSILRNNGRFSIHFHRNINEALILNAYLYTYIHEPKSEFPLPMMSIRLNPLSPPIVLTDLYWMRAHTVLFSQSVSQAHWPTVTTQTHSLLYRQIAYCRKFNAICNSSRASIQSFSIITWSRNGTRLFLLLLFNWITFITYLMYRYFKALTQKCRITGQPILFYTSLYHSHSLSSSILLMAAVQQKKTIVRVFQKKKKPNWKKQIVSYGNFMMTFAFQTVHLVWIFFFPFLQMPECAVFASTWIMSC